MLGDNATTLIDNFAQIAAGAFATVAGVWSWRRAPVGDRSWRLLLALGIGGWAP